MDPLLPGRAPSPGGAVLGWLLLTCGDPGIVADEAAADVDAGAVALSAGGLVVLADDTVVATDPDERRLMIRRPEGEQRIVPVGVPPGPVALGPEDTTLVVLRAADEVSRVTADGDEARRWSVCGGPRGAAWDEVRSRIWVACEDGVLAWYDPEGNAIGSVFVEPGLRDVVVARDNIWVSIFRTGEVLLIDDGGAIVRRFVLEPWFDVQTGREWTPRVALRMISDGEEGVVLLHQLHLDGPLTIATVPEYYGGGAGIGTGAVRSALARIHPTRIGQVVVLATAQAVDFALDGGDGAWVVTASGDGTPTVLHFDHLGEVAWTRFPSGLPGVLPGGRPFHGVAVLRDGRVAAALRSPAEIRVGTEGEMLWGCSPLDVGLGLFHCPGSTGVACSSCHPEGLDDAFSWTLDDEPRRTQWLAGGALEGTAPYHWTGDLDTLGAVWAVTGVSRMGAPKVEDTEILALATWLGRLPLPAPLPGMDRDLVDAGRHAFRDAGCADCHPAPRYTRPGAEDVGTGGEFQIPTLRGAVHRLPLLHDGCASTLEERFDPACGGDRHGDYDPEVVDALVAFLATL